MAARGVDGRTVESFGEACSGPEKKGAEMRGKDRPGAGLRGAETSGAGRRRKERIYEIRSV